MIIYTQEIAKIRCIAINPHRHNIGIRIGKEEQLEVYNQLIIANELPSKNGYTWTLVTLLGRMIFWAEQLFGKRDLSYTPLGIEFADTGPQVWFPSNRRDIVIQLTTECLVEPDRACFQLSHEVIHLLAPSEKKDTNVIEEGMASYFQLWFMSKHYPYNWPSPRIFSFELESYNKAKEAIQELLKIDSNAIKKLREVEPVISKISAELIKEKYPTLLDETSEFLASKFIR